MVYNLDLQTSHLSSLQDSRLAVTIRYPYMVVLGVCHAQILSNYPDSLQTYGNDMENSITPYCGTMWQGNTIPMFWTTIITI